MNPKTSANTLKKRRQRANIRQDPDRHDEHKCRQKPETTRAHQKEGGNRQKRVFVWSSARRYELQTTLSCKG